MELVSTKETHRQFEIKTKSSDGKEHSLCSTFQLYDDEYFLTPNSYASYSLIELEELVKISRTLNKRK